MLPKILRESGKFFQNQPLALWKISLLISLYVYRSPHQGKVPSFFENFWGPPIKSGFLKDLGSPKLRGGVKPCVSDFEWWTVLLSLLFNLLIALAIVFSRSGHHEEALHSLMQTNNWNMVLCEAKLLSYTDEQFIKLCRDLSGKSSTLLWQQWKPLWWRFIWA